MCKSWIYIIYVHYYTINLHIKKTRFPDAIVTLFLDIEYNITLLNRTEPELRFDEQNPNLTRSLVWFGSIGTLVVYIHSEYLLYLYI